MGSWIGDVGIGSTDRYSCLWVQGGFDEGPDWIAFPPPGPVPLELFDPTQWLSVDETGWTLQSNTIDLSGASVTITDGGTPRSVSVTVLNADYGRAYAISLVPAGWVAEAGHTYSVTILGVSTPIEYEVEVVDCG